MKKKYIWAILIAIIIFSASLRLWQLGNVPPSPDWDEAAIGYDAYSIINTGRDQFGKHLPIVLRSLDDYKPALYMYLTIPSIFIFGLNTFAVRLPSAIFGIISIFTVFFLVSTLFKEHKHKNWLALISSFLLAISPWSIQFSRVGFESNVGTVLNMLSALFFLKGLKKPWLLSISALFAGLAIYVYQSEKVFTPLLILALVLIYRRKLFSLNKKYIGLAIITGLIVVMPMVFYLFKDQASLNRARTTSIFSSQTDILKMNIQKLERSRINNDKLGIILDNRRIVYAKTVIGGYLSHFDLNWLFLKGDNERHHAPNMGLLYLFELPFLLLGIYFLIFKKYNRKVKLLIFTWVLIAPFPASITTGVPHAVRTLNFLPAFQIFIAIGIINSIIIISNFKHKILGVKLWKASIVCYLLFAIFNFSYYLNQYFVQLNYFYSSYWQYGYEQAVSEVSAIGDKYNQIIVSNDKGFDKSYIFFLFYLKYPPKDFQQTTEGRPEDAVDYAFGKYKFRAIDWEKDALLKNVLFIANPSEIPDRAKVIKTINNLDGTPAIKIVEM
ncbi:glycosyltransferase family 39 protein [Patescibacteria group bacterium]|nr:glycosyltransferase family 39 protein [Patescibacteria group bacterium]